MRVLHSLSFVDDPNYKLSFTPEGAIECRITGGAEIKPLIKWKPKAGVPAGIRLQDYDYLILTCRLEGDTKVANAQGRVTGQRPVRFHAVRCQWRTIGQRQPGGSDPGQKNTRHDNGFEVSNGADQILGHG